MTAFPLPFLSSPGRHPQAAGGRLINVYIEKQPETAGSKLIYWRSFGTLQFGTSNKTNFRGALVVANLVYVVIGDKCFTYPVGGGAGTALGGTVPGTAPVTMARNNAGTPDIVIVAPGDGALYITAGAVAAYPDPNVGQPNSVRFHRGVFVFTYGNGQVRNSNVNSLTVNSLNVATAESKPDTLLTSVPYGNSQIILAGSGSMELWGGQNDTGFIFSFIDTIPRGIAGQYAITGFEDGFGKGIFFVGDDNRVSRLNGYKPEPISPPDLDAAIEALVDKSTIRMSCYTARGHSFIVVRTPTWCWECDIDLFTWYERKSHQKNYWRGIPLAKFGEKWLVGDSDSSTLWYVSPTAHAEFGNTPIKMTIETGPLGAFPKKAIISAIEVMLTKGVGIATGNNPVETDPEIAISVSRDGGQNWQPPRMRKVGQQSIMSGRVRSNNHGHADRQGVRVRLEYSAATQMGIMGLDIEARALA